MPDIPSNPTPRVPPRRRLRFTLRLLLAGMTLLCIGLGIWTHRAREQRRIVERIRQVEGVVFYGIGFGRFDRPVNIFTSSPVPQWLLAGIGEDFFHHADSVWLHEGKCDQQLLADIARLPRLRELHIYTPQLTDHDLTPLSSASSLTTLWIQSSLGENRGLEIGDDSLILIGQLPAIRSVAIHGRCISVEGLAALAQAKTLREVSVRGCNENVDASVGKLFSKERRITDCEIWKSIGSGEVELIASWNKPRRP